MIATIVPTRTAIRAYKIFSCFSCNPFLRLPTLSRFLYGTQAAQPIGRARQMGVLVSSTTRDCRCGCRNGPSPRPYYTGLDVLTARNGLLVCLYLCGESAEPQGHSASWPHAGKEHVVWCPRERQLVSAGVGQSADAPLSRGVQKTRHCFVRPCH